MAGGSASALSLSRPAQALLTLRPAGSLSHPKVTFVTRLQPVRLPAQAARQLPDQSTTLRVDSSSTDDSRLRGALPIADITIPTEPLTTPRAELQSVDVFLNHAQMEPESLQVDFWACNLEKPHSGFNFGEPCLILAKTAPVSALGEFTFNVSESAVQLV